MTYPLWLEIAHRELRANVTEIPGADHNLRIVQYHEVTTLKATADETSWCSSFCCWCLEQAGFPHPASARARDWLAWGISQEMPRVGAVVVLRRGDPPQPGPEVFDAPGHVGFFLGWEGGPGMGRITLLDGNAGNRVSISRYPVADVLDHRWPFE